MHAVPEESDHPVMNWLSEAVVFIEKTLGIRFSHVIGRGAAGCFGCGKLGNDRLAPKALQTSPKNRMTFLKPFNDWPFRVGIKLISPDSLLGSIEKKGVRRVAKLQQKAPHPHLVTLYGLLEYKDGIIEFLELADSLEQSEEPGRDKYHVLDNQIWTKGIMPVSDAFGIIRPIGEAAQHLREHHLRHQDIRPANVIRVDGIWKLGDFGMVIPEGPQGIEGPLASYPYGSDTAGLARTMYAMLSGRQDLDTPIDPLPQESGKLADKIHDELICRAWKDDAVINTPAMFLRSLDKICIQHDEGTSVPVSERVRMLADRLAIYIKAYNQGMIWLWMGLGALPILILSFVTWRAGWPFLVIPISFVAVALLLPFLIRKSKSIWSVDTVCKKMSHWFSTKVYQESTPSDNLLHASLGYDCGGESGLLRIWRQYRGPWRLFDYKVSPRVWLSESFASVRQSIQSIRHQSRPLGWVTKQRNRTLWFQGFGLWLESLNPFRLYRMARNRVPDHPATRTEGAIALAVSSEASECYRLYIDIFPVAEFLRENLRKYLRIFWIVLAIVLILLLLWLFYSIESSTKPPEDQPGTQDSLEAPAMIEEEPSNDEELLRKEKAAGTEVQGDDKGGKDGSDGLDGMEPEKKAAARKACQAAAKAVEKALNAIRDQESKNNKKASGKNRNTNGGAQSGHQPQGTKQAGSTSKGSGNQGGQSNGAGLRQSKKFMQAAKRGTANLKSLAETASAASREIASAQVEAQKAYQTAKSGKQAQAAKAREGLLQQAAEAMKAFEAAAAQVAQSGKSGAGQNAPTQGQGSQPSNQMGDGGRDPGTGSNPKDHWSGSASKPPAMKRVLELALKRQTGDEGEFKPSKEIPKITPLSCQRTATAKDPAALIGDQRRRLAYFSLIGQAPNESNRSGSKENRPASAERN